MGQDELKTDYEKQLIQNEKITLEILEIFKSNQVSYRRAKNILNTVRDRMANKAIIQ